MKKKELVLAELANGNYNIESIVQKTEAKPKRVVEIVKNQVLKRNLEGMFNENETEFIPGEITPQYLSRIRRANISQILGILAFVLTAIVIELTFSLFFFHNDSIARAISAMTIGLIAFLISLSGTILSCKVRKTKVGKVSWILNMIMVIFYSLVLIAFIIYAIWARIVLGTGAPPIVA